jgi:diketogulonate reductase-like aldo/keto reductase
MSGLADKTLKLNSGARIPQVGLGVWQTAPARRRASEPFITAEPRVRKNSEKIVELNGIEPSAS